MAETGLADVAAAFGGHAPVLWDRDGILRDAKYPTPGPVERLRPERAENVTHRYGYDGGNLIQRETYRDKPGTAGYMTPELTRMIQTIPGGPLVFADNDGRIDVQMTDSRGKPLFMYRAQEGHDSNRHSQAHLALQAAERIDRQTGDDAYRGTGELQPTALPAGLYMDYLPWHLRVAEGDMILGRRGLHGWDGKQYDNGVALVPRVEADKSTDGDVVTRVVSVLVGTVLVLGGIAITVATFGAGIPLMLAGMTVGGALIGAGIAGGIAGAVTGDPLEAAYAGTIGLGGGAAGGLAAGLAMVGGAALLAPTVAQGLAATGLGTQLALGMNAGIAGGFAGGFTESALQGDGLGTAVEQGVYAGAVGGIMGVAGVGAGHLLGWARGLFAAESKYASTVFSGRRVFRNIRDFKAGAPRVVNRQMVHPEVLKRLDSGATNVDLMREGIAPIGRDGMQVNLHHLLGEEAGPMVELLSSTHQRFSSQLHGLIESGNSFRNDPKLLYRYNQFRRQWWINRANDF